MMTRNFEEENLGGPSLLNMEDQRAARAVHTDISILKTQQEALKSSLSEMNAKLDILVNMQIEMVRLREQHDHSKQAIDRAFKWISENEKAIDTMGGNMVAIDNKVNKINNISRGAMLVGAALYGMITYMAVQQIEQTKWLTQQNNTVDRRVLVLESRLNTMTGVGPRGKAE